LTRICRFVAYGNTETGDLWAAWAEASGKPVVNSPYTLFQRRFNAVLTPFNPRCLQVAETMKSWTTEMGFPLVSIEKSEETPDGVCIVCVLFGSPSLPCLARS